MGAIQHGHNIQETGYEHTHPAFGRVAPQGDLSMPQELNEELRVIVWYLKTMRGPDGMTEQERRGCCEKMMRGAFYLVGADPDAYPVCLEACVEKAMNTRLLFASSWSTWDGYESLKATMRFAQEHTDSTTEAYCPSAPILMATIALQRIRLVKGSWNNKAMDLMKEYETSDLAPTAIHNYVSREEGLICIRYHMAGQVTEQDEPNAEPLRELQFDSDCLPSSNLQSNKPSNATRLAMPNEQADATDGKTREGEPVTTEKVTREITREQTENELGDILELLKKDKDTSVTEEMAKRITLEHMKVLAPVNKSFIRMWAKITKDDRILGFFEQSPDDLEKYTWTEVVEKPMSTAWSTHPAYTVWNETKELVDGKGDSNLILEKLEILREILGEEANNSPDAPTRKQTAELREEATAIKGHLANVQLQIGGLKRQNDEVIQLLKGDKRLKQSPRD